MIGKGGFGSIYVATNKYDKNVKIAVKCVKKSGMSEDEIIALHNEIKILQQLDSPNICQYYENYEDEKFVYICMSLCEGGDLAQLFKEKVK